MLFLKVCFAQDDDEPDAMDRTTPATTKRKLASSPQTVDACSSATNKRTKTPASSSVSSSRVTFPTAKKLNSLVDNGGDADSGIFKFKIKLTKPKAVSTLEKQ